ncbi:hypothetical protein BGW80DRAFT_1328796 [Lactifluus volemus]|nr:hypothetical protein BGW80DRAFT_1328796 [Lactifluus volemus]
MLSHYVFEPPSDKDNSGSPAEATSVTLRGEIVPGTTANRRFNAFGPLRTRTKYRDTLGQSPSSQSISENQSARNRQLALLPFKKKMTRSLSRLPPASSVTKPYDVPLSRHLSNSVLPTSPSSSSNTLTLVGVRPPSPPSRRALRCSNSSTSTLVGVFPPSPPPFKSDFGLTFVPEDFEPDFEPDLGLDWGPDPRDD